jgi:putative transposase
VGKRRLQRLMQKHGIQARGKRKFRVTTTDSKHGLAIAPNVLDRRFTLAAPNQAWVGDITYIATEEGLLFLAVVLDLFSRKVVGWSMQPDMRRSLVLDALDMACLGRNPGKLAGLILHSDRGCQYASEDFAKALEHWSITPSISRKGNCWDNACAETLFASLKVERLHGQRFETIRAAKDETIAWLLWYNRTRMHSTLGYVSPIEFEQEWKHAQDRMESVGVMKNLSLPKTKTVTGYTWIQGGLTSYTVNTRVQNRLPSDVSLGAIVNFKNNNSIWIQESYSKVVTVPWYTTSSVGYKCCR